MSSNDTTSIEELKSPNNSPIILNEDDVKKKNVNSLSQFVDPQLFSNKDGSENGSSIVLSSDEHLSSIGSLIHLKTRSKILSDYGLVTHSDVLLYREKLLETIQTELFCHDDQMINESFTDLIADVITGFCFTIGSLLLLIPLIQISDWNSFLELMGYIIFAAGSILVCMTDTYRGLRCLLDKEYLIYLSWLVAAIGSLGFTLFCLFFMLGLFENIALTLCLLSCICFQFRSLSLLMQGFKLVGPSVFVKVPSTGFEIVGTSLFTIGSLFFFINDPLTGSILFLVGSISSFIGSIIMLNMTITANNTCKKIMNMEYSKSTTSSISSYEAGNINVEEDENFINKAEKKKKNYSILKNELNEYEDGNNE